MNLYYSDEKYRITRRTVAILPCYDLHKQSRVILEDGSEILTPLRPYQLLQLSCRQYSSSIEERTQLAKRLSNIKGKVPIIVDLDTYITFFPTKSPKREDCEWFAWSHISEIDVDVDGNVYIVTERGHRVPVNTSRYVLKNQIKITGELVARLQQTHIHRI